MIVGAEALGALLGGGSSAAWVMRSRMSSSAMPSSLAQSSIGQIEVEEFGDLGLQARDIPLLGIGVFGDGLGDDRRR